MILYNYNSSNIYIYSHTCIRTRPENMVLAGLWLGRGKPHMPMFLKPIVKSLNNLKDVGRCIHAPGLIYLIVKNYVFGFIGIEVPSQMSIHGITICVTCDLPAHALVQNMVQFNGFYGCTFCQQPGKTVTTAQGGNVHVYPYNHEDPRGPRRTHQGCESLALEATHDKPVSHHP